MREIETFADLSVTVDPAKMYDFLCAVPLEDGGLYSRCIAIGIENGFDKLDDDTFMAARVPPDIWGQKGRWVKKAIKETYGTVWFVPDAGRV